MFLLDLMWNHLLIETKGPMKNQAHLESIEATTGLPTEETRGKAQAKLSMEFLPENLAWITQTNKSCISVLTANVSASALNVLSTANTNNTM